MERHRCAHCGDVVGVYERALLLLLPEGVVTHGSPLTLGNELEQPGAILVHEYCYEAFDQVGE